MNVVEKSCDWSDRMDTVASVKTGWIDGTCGDPVGEMTRDIVECILVEFCARDILHGQRPGIYPLLRGGIQLEWEDRSVDWSIEVDNGGNVEISAFGATVDMDECFTAGESAQDTSDHVMETLSAMRGKMCGNGGNSTRISIDFHDTKVRAPRGLPCSS